MFFLFFLKIYLIVIFLNFKYWKLELGRSYLAVLYDAWVPLLFKKVEMHFCRSLGLNQNLYLEEDKERNYSWLMVYFCSHSGGPSLRRHWSERLVFGVPSQFFRQVEILEVRKTYVFHFQDKCSSYSWQVISVLSKKVLFSAHLRSHIIFLWHLINILIYLNSFR